MITGEVACQPELGVGGHDDPGPAVALVGCADAWPGPAQSLLEEPEGVFQVEVAQEGSPQAVQISVGEFGPGVPQPYRFGSAITGEPVHVEPDDAALDDGRRALARLLRRAVSQPRV